MYFLDHNILYKTQVLSLKMNPLYLIDMKNIIIYKFTALYGEDNSAFCLKKYFI